MTDTANTEKNIPDPSATQQKEETVEHARLKAHVDSVHGGPLEETLFIETLDDDQEKLDSLAEWHQEEHHSMATLAADDWNAQPPFELGSVTLHLYKTDREVRQGILSDTRPRARAIAITLGMEDTDGLYTEVVKVTETEAWIEVIQGA